MICHVVLYAMKPGTTERDEARLVEQARQKIPLVPGVKNFRAGRSLEGGTCAVALVMEFENAAALDAYRVDPDHQRFVKEVAGPVVSDTLRFDFRSD
ncbi:MAG TPA: Dabb family protein [Terriglobia bacterium]|nr:Dabb family protein [Terriglobia bacterium]